MRFPRLPSAIKEYQSRLSDLVKLLDQLISDRLEGRTKTSLEEPSNTLQVINVTNHSDPPTHVANNSTIPRRQHTKTSKTPSFACFVALLISCCSTTPLICTPLLLGAKRTKHRCPVGAGVTKLHPAYSVSGLLLSMRVLSTVCLPFGPSSVHLTQLFGAHR
ncbi:hypothetical protein BDV39DRAFT_160037 [Aspergillus sergii]|uniref:Uncharacterized protein n=1 Tax=Aspergillus sergii TaxID=1034303 RepID=A0A5N6WRF4_9EURO|nr:hypothetical protein BDV39DRAFT_160037 [Aspergillus sergii]